MPSSQGEFTNALVEESKDEEQSEIMDDTLSKNIVAAFEEHDFELKALQDEYDKQVADLEKQ